MSGKNSMATFVIYALAIIGLIVIAPGILATTAGLMGLLIQVFLWMVAGALAGRFLRGEGYGPLADIGLGIVGGVVGTFLFGLVGLGSVGFIPFIGPIIVGAVGAVVFVYIVRIFNSSFGR